MYNREREIFQLNQKSVLVERFGTIWGVYADISVRSVGKVYLDMLECHKEKREYVHIFLDFSGNIGIMKVETEMLPM